MRIIMLMVLSASAIAAPPVFDETRWFSFLTKASAFTREYLGCPPTGWPPDLQCSAGEARFDAKLWGQLSRQGKGMFQ